jgi:hypothetical protein
MIVERDHKRAELMPSYMVTEYESDLWVIGGISRAKALRHASVVDA